MVLCVIFLGKLSRMYSLPLVKNVTKVWYSRILLSWVYSQETGPSFVRPIQRGRGFVNKSWSAARNCWWSSFGSGVFLHATWCSWARFLSSEGWSFGHEDGWRQVGIKKAFLLTIKKNQFLKIILNLISLKTEKFPAHSHIQHCPYIVNQLCLALIIDFSLSLALEF